MPKPKTVAISMVACVLGAAGLYFLPDAIINTRMAYEESLSDFCGAPEDCTWLVLHACSGSRTREVVINKSQVARVASVWHDYTNPFKDCTSAGSGIVERALPPGVTRNILCEKTHCVMRYTGK